jgi:hypothetical protein
MKKLFGFILLSSLFLMSTCDPDQIDPVGPDLDSCQLQKTTWSIPGDPANTTTEFFYNSSDQLTEVVRTAIDQNPSDPWVERWVMTYAGDQLTQLKAHVSGELATTYDFYWVGTQVDSVWYDHIWPHPYQGYVLTEFVNDQLVGTSDFRFNPSDTTFNMYRIIDLTWQNGNVTRMETTYGDGVLSVTNYTYDNQRTPLYHFGLTNTSFMGFRDLSMNNVLSFTRTDTYPDGTVYDYEHSFSHSYNEAGYPTTMAQDGGNPTYYEYLCQ